MKGGMYTRHREDNPRAGLRHEDRCDHCVRAESKRLRVLERNLKACHMSTQPFLRAVYTWHIWWKRR